MVLATTNQNGTSSYVQQFIKSDIRAFDLTNGLRNEDNPKLESRNHLNLTVFEPIVKDVIDLDVTSKLLPFCISDNEFQPIDLLCYENQYCLIRKLCVFIGSHSKTHVC